MREVTVLILHRPAQAGAGPFEMLLVRARESLADRHVRGFAAAGARKVLVVGEASEEAFGARLRRLAGDLPPDGGVVVLGSGSVPLATARDRRAFVAAAAESPPSALANNRYSADVVAVAGTGVLRDLPDLPGDNALPRWLEEVGGLVVADLRSRWRLAIDLDSPADLLLPGMAAATGAWPLPGPLPGPLSRSAQRLAAVRAVMADRRAEVLVAGRTSAGTVTALERRSPARFRFLVEERGMRAASRLAQREGAAGRPPRSILATLLERDGPGALGDLVAGFSDAAVVDSRVLLAHRLGADEGGWPPAEDRFASDLLLPDQVSDPWLRDLTAAALSAPVPVLLGGHTLVGPGLRAIAGGRVG